MNLFQSQKITSKNYQRNLQNHPKKKEIKHSQTQLSKKEQFLQKLDDNQIMQQDLKNLERSVDLFIRDQDRIKYDFNKIIMDIQNLCEKANLSLSGAPFINITFALWRKQFYHKLEARLKFYEYKKQQYWKKQFCQMVDHKILQIFIQKMREPYQKLILQDKFKLPKSVETDKKYQIFQKSPLFQQFTETITEWCIEIETVQDLIERAELYGFYESPVSNKEFGKMLKQSYQINPQLPYRQNPKNYNEWKQKFSYLCQHKTDFYKQATLLVTNKLKSKFQSKGLTWSTGLTMFYGIMSGNPISLTAIILAGIGSTVLGKFLGLVSDFMEKDYSSKELGIIIETFQETTNKIRKQNKKCQELLILCFEEEGEDLQKIKDYQQQLKIFLDELVNEDYDQIFDDKGNKVIKTNKIENDWIQADFTDIKEFEIEDDVILVTNEEEIEMLENQSQNEDLLKEQQENNVNYQQQDLASKQINKNYSQISVNQINDLELIEENKENILNEDSFEDSQSNGSIDGIGLQNKSRKNQNKNKQKQINSDQQQQNQITEEQIQKVCKNQEQLCQFKQDKLNGDILNKEMKNQNQNSSQQYLLNNKVQNEEQDMKKVNSNSDTNEQNKDYMKNQWGNQSIIKDSQLQKQEENQAIKEQNNLQEKNRQNILLTKFPSKFESSIIYESDSGEQNSELCSFYNKSQQNNEQNSDKTISQNQQKSNCSENSDILDDQDESSTNIEFFGQSSNKKSTPQKCESERNQYELKDKNELQLQEKDEQKLDSSSISGKIEKDEKQESVKNDNECQKNQISLKQNTSNKNSKNGKKLKKIKNKTQSQK